MRGASCARDSGEDDCAKEKALGLKVQVLRVARLWLPPPPSNVPALQGLGSGPC